MPTRAGSAKCGKGTAGARPRGKPGSDGDVGGPALDVAAKAELAGDMAEVVLPQVDADDVLASAGGDTVLTVSGAGNAVAMETVRTVSSLDAPAETEPDIDFVITGLADNDGNKPVSLPPRAACVARPSGVVVPCCTMRSWSRP
jgi:hypothetical protein